MKSALSTLQSWGVLVVAHYNFRIRELQAQALQWHHHMPRHGFLLHGVEPRALLLRTSWSLVREEASQPTCCTVSSVGVVFSSQRNWKKRQLLSAWPCKGRNLKQLIRTRKEWTEQKESIPALSMISLRFCTAGKNSNELLQYLVIIASKSLRIP